MCGFGGITILLFVPTLTCGYNRGTMTTDANPTPTHTRKRARILILLTALLACVQFGAAIRALQVPQTVAEKISLPLPLDFVASLLWALISLTVLVLLWRRARRAHLYAAWLAIGFSIYSLLRLLLFSQAEYDRPPASHRQSGSPPALSSVPAHDKSACHPASYPHPAKNPPVRSENAAC